VRTADGDRPVPDVANDDWRSSRLKRLQVRAIAGLGYPIINALGRTLRWRVDGLEHLEAIHASGRLPIIGFWHGRILPGAIYFQRRGIVVITSENFDGEWIARIITRFGYGTARGSTSRGALKATLQLKREMLRNGKGTAFTLDGPRGPARVAQPGALWLARETGNPVLPLHLEASSHWTVRSWDRAQVPKPFSTVATVLGKPLYVDKGEIDLEAARAELERRLEQAEARAKSMLVEQSVPTVS
jgi:lysophospholipid acyltransferase (LPLAT)-like uncharacterized protein